MNSVLHNRSVHCTKRRNKWYTAPSLGRLWPLALAICPLSPPLQFALPLLLALIMISTASFTSGGSNLLVCSFYSSATAFSPHPLSLSFLSSLLSPPLSPLSALSLPSFAPPLISKPLIHVHTCANRLNVLKFTSFSPPCKAQTWTNITYFIKWAANIASSPLRFVFSSTGAYLSFLC